MAKMYTCDEVAERYKVKVITVWEWIRQRKLNAINLGREYRVSLMCLNVHVIAVVLLEFPSTCIR